MRGGIGPFIAKRGGRHSWDAAPARQATLSRHSGRRQRRSRHARPASRTALSRSPRLPCRRVNLSRTARHDAMGAMPQSTTHPRPRLLIPYLVLAVSLLLTVAVAAYVATSPPAKDRARFDNAVERTQTAIRQRIETYVNLLPGRGRAVREPTRTSTAASSRATSSGSALRRALSGHPGHRRLGADPAAAQGPSVEARMRREWQRRLRASARSSRATSTTRSSTSSRRTSATWRRSATTCSLSPRAAPRWRTRATPGRRPPAARSR